MSLTLDPYETKNTPGHGTAIPDVTEGETNETNREEGNDLMTSVDSSTDAHDFVDYMHEFNPTIKPGTPLWDLYVKERESEATAVVPRSRIVDALFPDAEPPNWAQVDETVNYKIPMYSNWRSIAACVNTRRMTGFLNTDAGTFAAAHLKLRIVQNMTAREPAIKVTRVGKYVEADRLDDVDDYLLTLEEAAELAHTLLLLLDVVNESTGA